MYLLSKIHKRLNDAAGRPVNSNWGPPTEKISEFLDHHLQPIMRAGKSYLKDTGEFLEKFKNLGNIPSNAILVTTDAVGLYPSIPHNACIQALYDNLEERTDKKIPSTDLVKMAELVVKTISLNLILKSFSKFLEQPLKLSLLPIYACLFMHRM